MFDVSCVKRQSFSGHNNFMSQSSGLWVRQLVMDVLHFLKSIFAKMKPTKQLLERLDVARSL